MKIHLPKANEVQITSLGEATEIIKLLLQKVEEIAEREPVRDTGLAEEIIHLRKETYQGFQGVNQRLDELTQHSQAHTKILEIHSTILKDHSETLKDHTTLLKGQMTIMKEVVEKLDEISKKLD